MTTISRRRVLQQAGRASLAAGAAAIVGAPAVLRAATPFTVTTSTLVGGWGELANDVFVERAYFKKYDFVFRQDQLYNVLATYYADFAKGAVEIGIGGWDFFAKVYQKGAPVRIIGIVSTGSMAGFLSAANGPNSLADLKGKLVSAMQVSSTYQMTKAWIREFDGLELEKDIKVQNAPNPNATIALLAANRADAALSWEHSLSLGASKLPGSKVFLNVGDYYKQHTRRTMPYFCIAMNANTIRKLPKDAVQRIVKAYDDSFKWIEANPDAYAAKATKLKVDPAVIKTAMASGRLKLEMQSMADAKNREDVLYAADILQKSGFFPKKLDDGLFAA